MYVPTNNIEPNVIAIIKLTGKLPTMYKIGLARIMYSCVNIL